MLCSSAWAQIRIACALVGSLGAFYTGILLINLVVALFALIAIESGSQILGRTYAVLLAAELSLDIIWFILFSTEIWKIDPLKYGKFSVLSVKVVFWMQTIGFSVRMISSIVWFQMYRLGVSSVNTALYQSADLESRGAFLHVSSPVPARQTSLSDEVLGGSIYDPAYYSSLFQDTADLGPSPEIDKQSAGSNGANSSPGLGSSHFKCYTSSLLEAPESV
ncbi:uncharacterized protein LOC131038356 isoform X2 [Cryptomeria japonica]|uniref:uncharacterized protein LOC131038356 isoform X2 n=1 Tax=Cryptomeria japonica TaxID=3369 RepID=UPI0027D9E1A0|nr:uncharacterized protein LOC131038356 isoform X2 [Cryptomeria japonica]